MELKPSFRFEEQTTLTDDLKLEIIKIWNAEFSKQLAYDSIEGYDKWLNSIEDPTHVLVYSNTGELIAWCTDFNRNKERWFSILIIRSHHGKGLGRMMLDKMKARNTHLCGWAVDHNRDTRSDGSAYPSPIAFYEKNGFEILDIRDEKKDLSVVKIKWEH